MPRCGRTAWSRADDDYLRLARTRAVIDQARPSYKQ
jgi:hypothetical protein